MTGYNARRLQVMAQILGEMPGSYNEGWLKVFAQAGITSGSWNGRMIGFIKQQTGRTGTDINGLMAGDGDLAALEAMAASGILYVASAVPASTTNSTSLQITYPATVNAGDVMYLVTVNDGANTDPTVGDTDTGGNAWTVISGTGLGISLWRKIAASGTAGKVMTATGFTTGCSAGLSVYRNVDQSTPDENVGTDANASGTESVTGITPTQDGSMVLFFVGNRAGGALSVSNVACTNPGALTQRFEHLNSTGGCSVNHASALQATAGATGNFTWEQANGATRTFKLNLLVAA